MVTMGLSRRLPIIALAFAVAGCPKESTKPRGSTPPTAADAPPPLPAAFRVAAIQLVSDAIVPATFDWELTVVKRMELEDAIEDGAQAVAATRARLGRFVVSFKHGGWDPYDAGRGRLTFRAHGLEGMDLDPPVSFVADPPVMVGSLPGPVGGSVRLLVSDLLVSAAVDAAGAAALVATEDSDPLITQYLMELGEVGEVDDATVVHATLHGLRLVRLGAREVLLEGKPAKPLR